MVRWLITALALVSLAGQPAAAQSESSSLRVREAASALVRGNIDQAITLYNEALEDKALPNDRRATILNDRGVAFARRQQHKDAIDDFNRAIQLYPEYAAVYNNRGSLLLGLGVVREAVKDFDRAIVLAPGYAAATCGCAAKETGTLRRAQAQDAVRSPFRLQLGSLGSRHQSAPWAFTHLPFLLEALSVRQRWDVYRWSPLTACFANREKTR